MMIPVEPLIASAKVFHSAIPAVSHTANGIFPFGAALNRTLKMNQVMDIIMMGLTNVQKKPSIEPARFCAMSRFAISTIRKRRWTIVRKKLANPRRIYLILSSIKVK